MGEGPAAAGAGSSFSLRALSRSTALVTGATAIAQLLMIGRELVVANQIGLSTSLDALVVALVVPTVATSLLTSGTTTAMVPAYLEAVRTHGSATARRLVGAVASWTSIAALGLTVVMLALPRVVIDLTGPGLGAAARDEALGLLPVVAPMVILGVLAGFLSAICQSEERFAAIAAATVVTAATSFIVTAALWAPLDITALALATSLATLATVLVLGVALARDGGLPRPALSAPRELVMGWFGHALPLTASAAVLSVNTIADRAIASLFRAGSLSALRYGDQLVRLPVAAIGPAWGTVTYPSLVRVTDPGSRTSLGPSAALALRYVLAVFVPIASATVALAPLLVDAVYRRGAFDAAAVESTSVVVAAFAPLIALTMAQSILVGAHNARRRGRVLLVAGIANTVLNLGLDVIFGLAIGVAGIALSSSVTSAVVLGYLAVRLASDEPYFRVGIVWAIAAKASLASLVAGIPVAAIAWSIGSGGSLLADVALLLGLSIAGGLIYLAMTKAIGLAEPGIVASAGATWLLRHLGRARA